MLIQRIFQGPPGYRAQSPWPPWPAIGVSLLIIIAATLVQAKLGQRLVSGSNGDALLAPHAFVGLLLVWQAIIIGGTIVAAHAFGGRPMEVLALARPGRGVMAYVIAVGLMLVVLAAFNVVLWGLFGHDLLADIRIFAGPVRSDVWLLAWLAVGLGAPVAEELLFRGFLLSALAPTRLGFSGAALICNTLWTLLHAGYSAAGVLEVFLIGALFSWIVWWTGSVRVAIFCHALYNSLLVLLLRFAPLPI